VQNALHVAWETIRDWWHGMVGLATLNLLWLGMSLTVVLLPLATAGMYGATHRMAHGKGQHIGDFIDAARRYGWVSLRWALVNLVIGALGAANYVFYGEAHGGFALVIQSVIACAGVIWLGVQFYVWPFLMEQERQSLRMALRNALFLTLANPLYTLVLLVISGLAVIISLTAILPFAVFTASFLSLLGNRAVIERLTVYGKLPAQPSGD
jgi:uncharacterized membrane protein YesL